MQALCPSDTSSPEIDHTFTLPPRDRGTAKTTKARSVVAPLQSASNGQTRACPKSRVNAPRPIKPRLRQLVVHTACAGGLGSAGGSSRICNRIATKNRRHSS
jgi:hypothetical protein